MKKRLIVCLVLLALCAGLCTLLAACGKDEKPSDTPSAASSAEAESKQSLPAVSSALSDEPAVSNEPAVSDEPAVSSAEPESKAEETSQAPEPSADEPSADEPSADEPSADEPSADEPSAYVPTPEEAAAYAHTWVCSERSADKETVCRLILSGDGQAQLVVQDGVGNLADLSVGSWSLRGAQLLELRLTTTMSGGKELAEGERFSIGGVYSAVFGQFNADITLGVTGGASPLASAQEGGPVAFYDKRYAPETIEQLRCCVLNYYAAQNGEPYPGEAVVAGIGEDGVLIQLVEDAGDHSATAGSYLIDPFTFTGTDEILGGTIEFSDYCAD